MEPNNVERNLQSLRRLYSLLVANARNEYIPETYKLDDNTQFLLKRLLDFASHEHFVTQSNLLATQLRVFPKTVLHGAKPSNVADSSETTPPAMLSQINGSHITRVSKPLEAKGTLQRDLRVDQIRSNPSKDVLTEEVVDAIEQIDTQLSALSFVSSRVDSDERTRSVKSFVTPPTEECRQNSQASMPCLRSNYMTVSQKSVISGAEVTFPYNDQLVRVTSPPQPLPPRAVSGFKKPNQSNRASQKMPIMKPTLMDQETETFDDDSSETEADQTPSATGSESEDEEVSTSQEYSGETGSSSGSEWETQAENDTESKSESSYPPQNDDSVSEVSTSPPHTDRDTSREPGKQRRIVMGRFKRIKNKIGQIFHHHHHHHHHHYHHDKEKPSAWNKLQSKFHHKHQEKSKERKRPMSESKGLTTHKQQHQGGHFHALVEGLVRHRKHSKKQKHQLKSDAKKTEWWKLLKKRQGGGVKIPKRGRVKLEKKKHYLSKNV